MSSIDRIIFMDDAKRLYQEPRKKTIQIDGPQNLEMTKKF